jgi:8-oxo-dGTP pyrophosphatase MutT (NUDIX family)
VVVTLYRKNAQGRIEVLLRRGIRMPIWYDGVEGVPPGAPELHAELVAGIIETRDATGEAGVRQRAADEALEEAGIKVSAADVELIGPASFATPGLNAERFYFAACDVTNAGPPIVPEGDGSPFEEGATLDWIDLDRGIDDSMTGRLADVKTELALRRLREVLRGR